MKVAIVLLGLVALSAAVPQPRNIIYDTAESLANAVISKATNELKVLESAVADMTSSLLSAAVSYVNKAQNDLVNSYNTVSSLYNTLVAVGGTVKTCAESKIGQLANIKNTVGSNLNYCSTDIKRTAGYITEDIGDVITQLNSSVSQLFGFVKECARSMFSAITCTISHINPTVTLVEGVISSAQEALSSSKALSKNALVTIEGCTLQTVATAVSQINDLTRNLRSCQ